MTVKDPVEVCGIKFPNRLGVAAGLDKNGEVFPALEALGFGHVEVGSITYPENYGREKKTLTRNFKNKSLTNHLGMPSQGARRVLATLREKKGSCESLVLGASFGVLPDTGYFEGAEFISSFSGVADYITVNVSCPNVNPNQDIKKVLRACCSTKQSGAPLFLKVSPDWEENKILDLIYTGLSEGFDGVVCANTKKGVSGAPLEREANRMLRLVWSLTKGKVPLIGVGGVFNRDDYLRKIDSGASLVQVYTGLVFGGPFTAKRILGE